MPVQDLFVMLHTLGATLTPFPDGTLRYKAPKGVLTPALLEALRQHKAELLELVEDFEERAASMEYDGGLSRAAAEADAWQWLLTRDATQKPQNGPGCVEAAETSLKSSLSLESPCGPTETPPASSPGLRPYQTEAVATRAISLVSVLVQWLGAVAALG